MTIPKTKTLTTSTGKVDGKPKTILLSDICKELQIKPREARMLLRLAISKRDEFPALAEGHIARQPWQWPEGSKAVNEARKALKTLAD